MGVGEGSDMWGVGGGEGLQVWDLLETLGDEKGETESHCVFP